MLMVDNRVIAGESSVLGGKVNNVDGDRSIISYDRGILTR